MGGLFGSPPPKGPVPQFPDDGEHAHHWQPIEVKHDPRNFHAEYIYALCPCGEARKFLVKQ